MVVMTSDPAALSPAQWNGKLAALTRTRSANDPEVLECREALAFWRCKRAIDAEVGHLAPAGVDRLVRELQAVAR